MRQKILLLSSFMLGILILVACPAWAGSRASRSRALAATVQVIVHTRFDTTRRCSGFLFSNSGQVLTSFHAVSDAESITVFHPDIGVYEVDRIRRIETRSDMAVLSLRDATGSDFPSVRLGDSRKVQNGDDIYVVHHPAYGKDALYNTTLSDIGYARQFTGSFVTSDFANEMILFQIHGPFDVGSSGGIVCNIDFEVIGMIVGGGTDDTGQSVAYAVASYNFEPMLVSSWDAGWDALKTSAQSDADFFDLFFGPAPQLVDYQAPMTEGYVAWFTPCHPTSYSDEEFTSEINDKISKNWFAATDIQVDGRPINELSASRIMLLPAFVNPWDATDSAEQYVHFDADSLFTKLIYADRDTEERIMTRYIMALALEPGSHTLRYRNRGANYKSTGTKRNRVKVVSANIELLDIEGLSFVSMLLLPASATHAGEGEPVRYELERRPLGDMEINDCLRRVRYYVEF